MTAHVDVWTIPLTLDRAWLPPTAAEQERAARFVSADHQRRFLRSHAGLREILADYTTAPLDFAAAEHGKPYLPNAPKVKFNLSHSHELALLAVTRDIEIGVDIERYRPLSDCLSIAERFFPPSDAADLADTPADRREIEFFRRWTCIEAVLKGRGIGLYAADSVVEGWTVQSLDIGPDYAAAVAANCSGIEVSLRAM